MGSAAAVLLYGVLLSQFTRYLQSTGWHRSTWPNRIAILVVMVFVTIAVALSLHDIWYYATLTSLDLGFVLSGTAAQGFEPACFYGGFSVAYHYNPLVNTDIGLDWNGWYQAWLWTAAAVDLTITSVCELRSLAAGDNFAD
ncbi:hypothetical protein Rhopal_005614-T1 [Rhodotorula paludigena]|uniref:Uncharacterized protein n=1 Tax=Rhodotorula paludigena TaxID=86838 RepID=A0AAV5GQX4_9BASI|nr:hypothetical protein Rhopal_005614-T1 [Rhodotorula paludigena]